MGMNSVFIGSNALAQRVDALSVNFDVLGNDVGSIKQNTGVMLAVEPIGSTSNSLVLVSESGNFQVSKNYERVSFLAVSTNSAQMSVSIDGSEPFNISNVFNSYQVFNGALVTLTYMNGSFFLTSQINPLSGNQVSQIGKLVPDTLDLPSIGELVLDGSTISRATHPILWEKVSATSNLVSQSLKDSNPQAYAGFYGDGDGTTTFTIPTYGGEFPRFHDNGRGIDSGREFGSWQNATHMLYQDDSLTYVAATPTLSNISEDATGLEPPTSLSESISRRYVTSSNSQIKSYLDVARTIRPRSIAVAPKIFI